MKNEILGTGIILSNEGVIVTCYHVIGVMVDEEKALKQKFIIPFLLQTPVWPLG